MRRPLVSCCFVVVASAIPARGQEIAERITLASAVATASSSFSEVRASEAELSAAEEGLGLARKAYLPGADFYLQWNRATRNNVFGLLLPGGVPSITITANVFGRDLGSASKEVLAAVAERKLEAAKANAESVEGGMRAAEAAVRAVKDMES